MPVFGPHLRPAEAQLGEGPAICLQSSDVRSGLRTAVSEHCLGLVLMVLRGDKLIFLNPARPVASIMEGRGLMGGW